MKKLLARFVRETEGQDLIEYAPLAALIGLATTAAMTALSTSISTEFGKSAPPSPPPRKTIAVTAFGRVGGSRFARSHRTFVQLWWHSSGHGQRT